MDYLPSQIIPGTKEYYLFKVSQKSQAIYLTLSLLVITVMVLLPFIYVDVSVSAPGFITTQYEQQSLTAPSGGRVLFSRIISNERVEKGDTLLILDQEVLNAHLRTLTERNKENKESIRDLDALVSIDSILLVEGNISLVSSRYASDLESFRRQYLHHILLVNKYLVDYERSRILFHQDVLAKTEYESTLFLVREELAKLEAMLQQKITVWQDDLTARLVQQRVINAEISNLRDEMQRKFLLAPMDGTILISADVQVGSNITVNQRLGELSPDAELIVSAMVVPVNAGYLYEGQNVKVQIDAYNYNQWGLLEGSVIDLSDDVLIDQLTNTPYYRVNCKLLSDTLTHRNGAVGKMKKGMTANVRFIQSRESLFTLLIKRADSWLNPSVNKN
jgi:HlyD family secretion protein